MSRFIPTGWLTAYIENLQVMRDKPFLFYLLGWVAMPLTQTAIWITGAVLNSSLLYQFGDGVEDDPTNGLVLGIVVGAGLQFFMGGLLGSLTAWAIFCSSPFRRYLLLIGGTLGTGFFGWTLKLRWSFEANHCFPDGCISSSSLPFDFFECVLFGLPLLWCLAVVGVGVCLRSD